MIYIKIMIKYIKMGVLRFYMWYTEDVEIRLFVIQHWPRYWAWYKLGYIDITDEDDMVDLIINEFNATRESTDIPKIVKWALD